MWWPTYAILKWGRAKKIQEGGLLNALATTELGRAMRLALDFRIRNKLAFP
jgi:hypothetical protein